ncbi:uncharacterized protein SPAPADRAFT_66302 [Spathaspora passalidarum NRRL Y-27907]|uniref:Uncharacterized protein n=1 Tax=Spathaspora passalidarum (strain NRRL Y-27907 / 11-Y1) TaxID=619300 RepID=G3ALX5_SPAPN|nr:uncharacterized protein SPAPADRAFT_66302 [Spathaspora passalidarum NRRL Y-27907]EGW33328.1 hypothetical protein SPAPADRAFT_66302 [Spathaspora passalidarum NRRL Y-27907]
MAAMSGEHAGHDMGNMATSSTTDAVSSATSSTHDMAAMSHDHAGHNMESIATTSDHHHHTIESTVSSSAGNETATITSQFENGAGLISIGSTALFLLAWSLV